MMYGTLAYDDATHTYSVGGVLVPGVTQLLTAYGLKSAGPYPIGYAERGKAVHEWCERYARGERVVDGLQIAEYEYINAFANWMEERKVHVLETEVPVVHSVDGMMYAGRLDLLADLNVYGVEKPRVLVDIKSGVWQAWHKVQLAAYALAVKPGSVVALYLRPDGTWEEEWISTQALLAAVNMFVDALRNYYDEKREEVE